MTDFNWKFYVDIHKDLLNNGICTKELAYDHYITYGMNEFREMQKFYIDNSVNMTIENFDWIFYINYHKDLLDEDITTKELAWEHWNNSDIKEVQMLYLIDKINITIENFDWIFYLDNNKDLINKKLLSKELAWHHWNDYGSAENRSFAIYDDLNENKYLKNSFVFISDEHKNDLELPLKKYYLRLPYLLISPSEFTKMAIEKYNITIENFDWEYYLKYNEDLCKKSLDTKENAWNHWNSYGIYENRRYRIINEENISIIDDSNNKSNIDVNIKNFDWIFYINFHLDLLENGIITKKLAWNHWTNFGQYENREFKLIDNQLIDNIEYDYIYNNNLMNNFIFYKENIENLKKNSIDGNEYHLDNQTKFYETSNNNTQKYKIYVNNDLLKINKSNHCLSNL